MRDFHSPTVVSAAARPSPSRHPLHPIGIGLLTVGILIFGLFSLGCTSTAPAIHPLNRAHSHNDYRQSRPLDAALELGFGSVEADVFLVDGRLLVGHDPWELRPERTIEVLYLAPLIERARAGHGHVLQGLREPLILLVDLKSEGEAAYAALSARLADAPDVFSSHEDGVVFPRAVTVVISGNIPRATIAAESKRYAFADGRLPDLEAPLDRAAPAVTPLVSLAWRSQLKWDGKGEIPADERAAILRLVQAAHLRGYKFRLWGVPNREEAWRVLHDAGVDLINVDDLERAAARLREWEK